MLISLKAQYIYEYHTLKALFLESSQQGDQDQARCIMDRMEQVSNLIDDMESTQ